MSYLVISTCLNPESRSFLLAQEAHRLLGKANEANLLDLRKARLPLFNGKNSQGRAVRRVREKIVHATCILVAAPVYNYDVGAAVKNLIEHTGDAWGDKTVGFMIAAGGKGSRMAFLGLANSMMLDFRCLIIRAFVLADKSNFSADKSLDAATLERLQLLVDGATRLNGVSIPKETK